MDEFLPDDVRFKAPNADGHGTPSAVVVVMNFSQAERTIKCMMNTHTVCQCRLRVLSHRKNTILYCENTMTEFARNVLAERCEHSHTKNSFLRPFRPAILHPITSTPLNMDSTPWSLMESEIDSTCAAGSPPASLSSLVRTRAGRAFTAPRAAAVAAENAAYLTLEATMAPASGPSRRLSDEAVSYVDSTFEDAPVYRSAGPAMPAAAHVSLPPTLVKASRTASPVFTPSMIQSHKAATARAAAFTFPAMPQPYVLTRQSWVIPSSVDSVRVVSALAAAFSQLKMDATYLYQTAEFKCAATIEFRCVRFTARLFQTEGTCVEFQLNAGGSLEYHQAYSSVVAQLPQDIAKGCAARAGASGTRKSLSLTPPSLDGAADVATISKGDAEPLVRMAASGMRSLQRDATASLAELSTVDANAAVLVADGALSVMATLVSTCSDWVTVQGAVTVIANVLSVVFASAVADPVKKTAVAISEQTVRKILAEVKTRSAGRHTDAAAQQALRRECCRALASMTQDSAVAHRIRAEGGDAVLQSAFRGYDVRESAHASTAMSRLVAGCA